MKIKKRQQNQHPLFADIIQTNPNTEFPSSKVEMGPEGLMDLFAMRTVYGGPSTINPATIMFQTGYLTVKDYDPQARIYTLDFPNVEVRESMQVLCCISPHMAPPRP